MIKEVEITTVLVSVEKDEKIIKLYFGRECPPLETLYLKYGKSNVHVEELKSKRRILISVDGSNRRNV